MKDTVSNSLATIGFAVGVSVGMTVAAESSPYPYPSVYEGENPTIQLQVPGTYRGNLYNGSSSIEPPAYDPFTKGCL
jgi:hypothetical protein